MATARSASSLASRILLGACACATLGLASCDKGNPDPLNYHQSGTPGLRPVVEIKYMRLGKAAASDGSITAPTTSFEPADTIYVSVTSEGMAQHVVMTAKWTYENEGSTIRQLSQTFDSDGVHATSFHLADGDGWPVGRYRLQIFVNGQAAALTGFVVNK